MRARSLSFRAVGVLLLAGGCTAVMDERTFCETDSDCAGGALCVRNLCAMPSLEVEPLADAGSDAGADTGASDAGVSDAGSDGGSAGGGDGGSSDGGTSDGGSDGGSGSDAGGWDAGVPYACDCSLATCALAVCAPGARCSGTRCVHVGTACWVDPTGSAACDEPSCAGLACGAGRGSCLASGVCVSAAKPGCELDARTGVPDCTNPECLGISCGTGSAVCTALNGCAVTAVKLLFEQQPAGGVAGSPLGPVMVKAVDAAGNLASTFAGAVTISVGGVSGVGPFTVSAVGGVATFSALSIDLAGAGYTLSAAATGLAGATSASFDVAPSTAAKLAFLQQPTDTSELAPITPAVRVSVLDGFGNLVPSAAVDVSVALAGGDPAATLSGARSVSTAGGVATFSTLSLDKAAEGYTLQASAAGLVSAGSAAFAVLARLPQNTVPPLVTGTAIDGQTLAADDGTWTGSEPMTFAHRWQRCDGTGAACEDTGVDRFYYAVGPLDIGYTLVDQVTATNAAGSARATSAPTSIVAAAPPVNTSPPSISGTARDLEVLTASAGSWSGTSPLSYTWQWQRCDVSGGTCVDLNGARASSYAVTSADVGQLLRVSVTASNGTPSAVSAKSALTAAVLAAPMVNTSAPTIAGTFKDGATLTGAEGAWTGTGPYTLGWQWRRCFASSCADLADATGSTYRVQSADVDGTLVLVVTASNALGPVSAPSAATAAIVGIPPTNQSPPKVSGNPVVGGTLTAEPGTWGGTSPLAFAFQWQRSADGLVWTDLQGATGLDYVVLASDGGARLRVVVSARNECDEGCSAASQASLPVGPVEVLPPVVLTAPTIQGTPIIGTALAAEPGTWAHAPSSFAFKWLRCDLSGTMNCVDTGVVLASYVLGTPDYNHRLQVVVTATNAGGSGTASSAPTAAVLLPTTAPISSTPVSGPLLPVPDRGVRALARVGSTLYLGGDFTRLGTPVGRGALLSAATGECDLEFSRIGRGNLAVPDDEEVRAVAPDGAGGWYVGGAFSRVGDKDRRFAARLGPDGALDAAWAPQLDGEVNAILLAGSRVYLGGAFLGAGGTGRRGLVIVDAASGALVATSGPSIDGEVLALATDGTRLFVGGAFQTVGTESRGALAAIDLATGALLPWRADVGGVVRALAVESGTLYVGGAFSSVGGQACSNAAALSLSVVMPAMDLGVNGEVRAIASNSGGVVLGGDFTAVKGVPRVGAASVASGGVLRAWDPKISGCDAKLSQCAGPSVRAVALAGTTVYLGGSFLAAGGQPRSYLAAVDASNALVRAWAPEPDRPVNALAHWSGELYAGGSFGTINSVPRAYAAAIDVPSRKVTAWAPQPNAPVRALAASTDGTTVYLGGAFTALGGGVARGHLAAVDRATGAASPWNPGANGEVLALLAQSDGLYVGGAFTALGGAERNRLAKVDAAGGLLPWNPSADGPVHSLSLGSDGLWVAGSFSALGGTPIQALALLTHDLGDLKGWNAALGPGTTVHGAFYSGAALFIAGEFTSVGAYPSVPRLRAAALQSTGAASPFDPSLSATGRALASAGQTVYLGGDFTAVNGSVARNLLAAVSWTSGAATAWDARLGGAAASGRQVSALSAEGDGSLWVAGVFDDAGARAGINNLAYFTPQPAVAEGLRLFSATGPGPATFTVGAMPVETGVSVTHQWRRCDEVGLGCTDIEGATGPSYTVTSADVGRRVRIVVTATNAFGATRQASLRSPRVTAAMTAVTSPEGPL